MPEFNPVPIVPPPSKSLVAVVLHMAHCAYVLALLSNNNKDAIKNETVFLFFIYAYKSTKYLMHIIRRDH